MDTACREAKKELRRLVAQREAALEEAYLAQSNAAIAPLVLGLPEYVRAQTVFCFVSMGREVETRPILLHALGAGKHVGVPLCTGKGIMEIRRITGLEQLVPGFRGILEPRPDCPVLTAEQIDFALIPCVCCNKAGLRLGHGGGYYDRYLERAGFASAIVCRERLICDEVPVEPHDIPMKTVITELGVIRL